jgi:hypothetical protein
VEQTLAALLTEFPHNLDSQRLRERYRKHRHALFVFLHDPEVPPTNNASGQALNSLKLLRKGRDSAS